MISISVCMIVKNEEDVLERCLNCIADIADEIVIVDTGSIDKTKEIAKKFTDNIYDFKWINDFSKARNFSFSKASKDYVMWLDADDVIYEEDREKLKSLKENLSNNVDMVIMKYNVAFDENNNPTFSYNRERIMKRAMDYKWVGAIHEVIAQCGNIEYSDISISHRKLHSKDSKRNIKIFEQMISEGKALDPREQYYYGRELYFNERYDEAIDVLSKFINSGLGWIENNINACQDLANCYFALKNTNLGLQSLFRSFEFDAPRAEICCDIGSYFISREEYNKAVFWYDLASTRVFETDSGGFQLVDCYGYIPYIQLCVCYDRLGNKELAKEYNDKAGILKPNDKAYLYNKEYFDTI